MYQIPDILEYFDISCWDIVAALSLGTERTCHSRGATTHCTGRDAAAGETNPGWGSEDGAGVSTCPRLCSATLVKWIQ